MGKGFFFNQEQKEDFVTKNPHLAKKIRGSKPKDRGTTSRGYSKTKQEIYKKKSREQKLADINIDSLDIDHITCTFSLRSKQGLSIIIQGESKEHGMSVRVQDFDYISIGSGKDLTVEEGKAVLAETIHALELKDDSKLIHVVRELLDKFDLFTNDSFSLFKLVTDKKEVAKYINKKKDKTNTHNKKHGNDLLSRIRGGSITKKKTQKKLY